MRARDTSPKGRPAACTVRWSARSEAGNPGASGSVILLVLMTLLLTAFALTKYLERTTIDLLADARDASADRLRVDAYSALETVLGVLQEFRTVDGALRSPAEGWGTPLEFAGYTPPPGISVTVSLEDESGKISLPHADFQTLQSLFILLGQKQTDAERLADALLVWMQPGYQPVDAFSARAADYEREDPPCDPPGRSLHSFAELASIKYVRDLFFNDQGQPNELWRQFVDSVSLFDFTQPNINAARETTLGAVGGYDTSAVKAITDYLDGQGPDAKQGPTFFRNPQDVAVVVGQTATSPRLTTQVSCLRINVTVRQGTTSFRLSAVVAPPGGARLPPPDTTNAATSSGSPAATTANAQSAATPGAGTATGAPATTATTTMPSLNYPFTLLQIRENDQIVDPEFSSPPVTE